MEKKPKKSQSTTIPTNQDKAAIQELQKSNQALLNQVTLLQEQLLQRKQDDEELNLENKASKIQQQQAQLKEDADLKKLLADATQPGKLKVESIDELSQKDVIDILAGTVGKALDAQSKLMEQRTTQLVSSLSQRIDGTQKVIMDMMAGLQVNKAQEKFKDFGEYTQDVKAILKDNPTMSIERAYILAKAEKSMQTPAQQQVETERPSNGSPYTPSYSEEEESNEEPQEPSESEYRNPKRDFRDAALKAVEKVIAARQHANANL